VDALTLDELKEIISAGYSSVVMISGVREGLDDMLAKIEEVRERRKQEDEPVVEQAGAKVVETIA
jgi:hypothetical protein